MTDRLLIDELSWVEIRDRIAAGWKTAIVPLGATEQHGPALPLLTDSEHGVQTATRAARKLGKTFVGPVVAFGFSPEHTAFPGTISLSKATLAGVIHDIAESHARSGIKLVYFWIGHGGSFSVLCEILPSIALKWPGCYVTGLKDLTHYISTTWDVVPLEQGISLSVSGSHAGEFETSMMLSTRPDLVRMDVAEKGCETPFGSIAETIFTCGIQTIAPNGVLGDQRQAHPERGARYLNRLAAYLVADLEKEKRQMEFCSAGL